MFGRRNIDDFDDYKREQEEERREKREEGYGKTKVAKDRALWKLPKMKVTEDLNGNVTYRRDSDASMIFFILVFMLWPLIAIGVTVSNHHGRLDMAEVIPTAMTYFLFSMFIIIVFAFSRFGFGTRARKVVLAYDEIICYLGLGKKLAIPYDKFIRLDMKRTYGKHHRYQSTIYTMIFSNPNTGKERKIIFPCREFYTVSDFNQRLEEKINKATDKVHSAEKSSEPDTGEFIFPGHNRQPDMIVKFINFFVTCLLLFFFFIVVALFVTNQGINNPGVIGMGVFFILFAIMSFTVLFASRGTVLYDYPDKITFEEGGLRVDEKFFMPNEIKAIYLTPIGRNNARFGYASTLDIFTDAGRYCYKVGYYANVNSNVGVNRVTPSWAFDKFYNCSRKWAKKVGVRFIDLIM